MADKRLEVLKSPPKNDKLPPVETTLDVRSNLPKVPAEPTQNVTPPKDEGKKSDVETKATTPITLPPILEQCVETKGKPGSKQNKRMAKSPSDKKCTPADKSAIKPWVPPQGRKKPDKEELRRRSSKITFTMPKVREPHVIEGLKREKMVHKLLKYMKKSWRVSVDPRQAERVLVYRTIDAVHTQHPDNWEELNEIRAQLIDKREESSKQRGFFCGYDMNYPLIYNYDLDTPLLVFHNLAPDLKITAARWLRMKALKEELKRKRDAFLPRLPNRKFKRPNNARGKLLKDPGGLNAVDEFVQVAERFRQLCKGSNYYAQVLEDWYHKKEDENENVNFGFGSVPNDFKYGFTANQTPDEIGPTPLGKSKTTRVLPSTVNNNTEVPTSGEMSPEQAELEKPRINPVGSNDRRDSMMVDGRKYQREMLQMEDMIYAIYDLIKSMLNIKIKQINSNLPLPVEVVMQLRDISPEPREKKVVAKKGIPKRRRHQSPKTPPPMTVEKGNAGLDEEEDLTDEELCIELENAVKQEQEPRHSKRKTVAEAMLNLDPLHIHPEDFIATSPNRSSNRIVEEVKRVHALQEKMEKQNREASAQAKIKSLMEDPEHAGQRFARNARTYGRLFERHQKQKPPIWHHLQVDDFISKYSTLEGSGVLAKDPTNLTAADAEEVVDMAIRKRQMLSTSRRWPDTEDIPTPTFPFPSSPRKISSQETSRKNLLAMMPHMDDIPSTPIRRLFKLAGVRTTEKQTFNMLLDMKHGFRSTEKRARGYCHDEIFKMEFDTMRRYRTKLISIYDDPVYQWCIAMMRQAMRVTHDEDDEEGNLQRIEKGGVRRNALWFRKLLEECGLIGAIRHSGCQQAIAKLLKYCDIDVKSKPHLLSRLALLVVSLPTTELGNRSWQLAIQFLLEHLFGCPKQVLVEWLTWRHLPLVIS